MTDGMWPALSGALAQQRMLDVTANNVANASTPGYRGNALVFREVLSRATTGAGAGQLRYAQVDANALDRSAGAVQTTGRSLDVALPDKGFFAVQTPAGERYTRSGQLRVGADLVLRTAEGSTILGVNRQPIQLPSASAADSAHIGDDGTVSVGGASVGRLLMVDFADPSALEKDGPTVLRATDRSGEARQTEVTLMTGALEGSNVSAVKGMIDLVTITRAFDACQRVLDGMREADKRGIAGVIAPRQ